MLIYFYWLRKFFQSSIHMIHTVLGNLSSWDCGILPVYPQCMEITNEFFIHRLSRFIKNNFMQAHHLAFDRRFNPHFWYFIVTWHFLKLLEFLQIWSEVKQWNIIKGIGSASKNRFVHFGPPTFGRKGSYKITPVVSC